MLEFDVVGLLSIVVLLGLAFLSYFTYRLYRSRFFLFFWWAWLANVIYVVCESWLKKIANLPESLSSILIYFISLISTYFFLFALKSNKIKKLFSDIRIYIGTSLIISWFIIFYFIIPSHFLFKYQLLISPGIIISSWILIRIGFFIGNKINFKLDELLRGNEDSVAVIIRTEAEITKDMANREGATDILDHVQDLLNFSRKLFIFCFLIYGIIQPLYLLRPIIPNKIFTLIFFFAIVIKILIGSAILILATADFRYCQIATKVRSIVEEVSVMTENVEHGIRGPTSSIIKDLILLKDRVQNDGYLLNKILDLKENIERIRDYASVIPALKETEGYYENRFHKWNLIFLVRESSNTARNKFLGAKIKFIFDFPKNPVFILGYKERLVEAISNIITNSIEAYYRKNEFTVDRQIEISISTKKETGIAILKIKDYAGGIPENILSIIANARFSTKDVTSDPNRGLGLFFSKLYIKQHRGKIYFESDGNSFTVVTVEFPLAVSSVGKEDI